VCIGSGGEAYCVGPGILALKDEGTVVEWVPDKGLLYKIIEIEKGIFLAVGSCGLIVIGPPWREFIPLIPEK
jgi:hypothetical protein